MQSCITEPALQYTSLTLLDRISSLQCVQVQHVTENTSYNINTWQSGNMGLRQLPLTSNWRGLDHDTHLKRERETQGIVHTCLYRKFGYLYS